MVRAYVSARCGGRRCGSANSRSFIRGSAPPKSEDARLESLADPSAMGDIDENDPKSVAGFMKKMGREMGEDFGEDVDQAIEEEMAGGGEGDSGGGDSDDHLLEPRRGKS